MVFGDVDLRTDIARAVLASAGVRDVPFLTGLGVPITEERIGLMSGHEGKTILDGRKLRMQTREDEDPDGRIEALAEVAIRTALQPGDVEKLAGGDALARQISALSAERLRFQSEHFGSQSPRVVLHGPLTAPSWCTTAFVFSRRASFVSTTRRHPSSSTAHR